MSKLDDSIKAQKEQLSNLISKRYELRTQLKGLSDAILQLQGALAAFDYVKSLEAEATSGKTAPESKPKAVK